MAAGMKCPGSNKETEGKHLVSFLILNSVDNKTAGSICPVEDLLSPAPQWMYLKEEGLDKKKYCS